MPTGDKTEGTPQDVRNGVATAALVVGILAVIVVPLGVFLGTVSVVLAFVSLMRARHMQLPNVGRMRAVAALCLGAVSIALSTWTIWLFPSLPSQPLSASGVCRSNLRAIGQASLVYANDNFDAFPLRSFGETEDDAEQPFIRFVGQMGANYRTPLRTLRSGDIVKRESTYADPSTPGLAEMQRSIHPSRSLFMLVEDGIVTAKGFICPSSGDREDDLGVSNLSASGLSTQSVSHQNDFKGYPYLSYGYQLPFARVGRPSPRLNPNMPIMADKGPFFKAGPPRADGTVPDAPTMPPGTAITISGATTADALLRLPDSAWRPFNSRNHQQAGQNVLFVDGHVEGVTKPIVGVNGDNIYTVQSGGSLLDSLLGRTPADELRPRVNSDSVIVP